MTMTETLRPAPRPRRPSWLDQGVSVLNGFLGDYLTETENGLDIEMAFYHENAALALDGAAIRAAYPNASSKLCVLAHGLASHEGIWSFRDSAPAAELVSYGTLLQADFGYTPFYLRYNTGRPVYHNGQQFAALLDKLLAVYPVPVEDIVLIGHSMGGLVIRSACHYGELYQYDWVARVTRIFYLGTPHAGAPLERLVSRTARVLHAVPNPITKVIGDVLNVRSRGIKDLGNGRLLDYETLEDPEEGWRSEALKTPWLEHAQHYMAVGTLTADPTHILGRAVGDALVLSASARGVAEAEAAAHHHFRVFPGVRHTRLAHDAAVYAQIKAWCEEAENE